MGSSTGLPLAVSNAANGNGSALAPGSIASIYGMGLAMSTASANSFPLPPTLGGASVTVNGVTGPILYASAAQINFQIPFEAATGSATISVSVGGAVLGTTPVLIQAAAPGLFVQPQGLAGAGNAAVINQDGFVNSPSQPAAAGTVIAAYATGLGAVNPPVLTGAAAPSSQLFSATGGVTATIGGVAATVQFAGLAPGFAGLYQVNMQVPQLAPGAYPLRISVGGATSNSAPVSIH